MLWANSVFEWQDALLNKIVTNISYESLIKLHNASIYHPTELFPSAVVYRTAESSNRVFHDGAICKAVTFERKPSQPGDRKSQFSMSASGTKLYSKLLEPSASSKVSSKKGASIFKT